MTDARSGNRYTGVFAMLLSVSAGTSSDALMRAVSQEVPTGQILVIRGLLMATVAGIACGILLRTSTWSRLLSLAAVARALVDGLAILFFFLALPLLPLGDLVAITLSSPILASAISAILRGERISIQTWLALLVGFCGVGLIVRPTMETINVGAMLALSSAVALAARDLMTRTLDRSIPSVAVALASSLSVLALGGLYTAYDAAWVGISLGHWSSLIGSIVLLLANSVLGVVAFRASEVSIVSPIRYASLPIAMALSYLMFGDIPDLFGVVGGLLIVGCGVVVAISAGRPQGT